MDFKQIFYDHKIEVKWASLIALSGLVWLVMAYLIGFHTTKLEFYPIMYLIETIFLFVIALLFSLIASAEKITKYLLSNSYKTSIKICLEIGFWSTLLGVGMWAFYFYFINPDFFINITNFKKVKDPVNFHSTDFTIYTFIRQFISNRLFQSLIIALSVPVLMKRVISQKNMVVPIENTSKDTHANIIKE